LILAVGPEGIPFLRLTLNDDHADQVDEPLVGDALDVQIDLDRAVRELRRPEDVDPLVADGEGLEGVVAVARLADYPLALAAR
jgi:hypothetical protein